jgi:prefoldin subunit 5
MDWVSLIGSGVAVFISTVCAILHGGRRVRALPREVNAHQSAIASLRKQHATLLMRLRKIEAAIPTVTGDRHGA